MAKASREGREELISHIQAELRLSTRKEAEHVVNSFLECLENTLLTHLSEDGFCLKLNGLGKLWVHHKPPVRRKVGFSGEQIITKPRRLVKFTSLGLLRRSEALEVTRELTR